VDPSTTGVVAVAVQAPGRGDNATVLLTVLARNGTEAPITHGGERFAVSLSAPSGAYTVEAADLANGTYRATLPVNLTALDGTPLTQMTASVGVALLVRGTTVTQPLGRAQPVQLTARAWTPGVPRPSAHCAAAQSCPIRSAAPPTSLARSLSGRR
jgi:hypothetical protein